MGRGAYFITTLDFNMDINDLTRTDKTVVFLTSISSISNWNCFSDDVTEPSKVDQEEKFRQLTMCWKDSPNPPFR